MFFDIGDGFNHVTAYSCLSPCLKGYIPKDHEGPNFVSDALKFFTRVTFIREQCRR